MKIAWIAETKYQRLLANLATSAVPYGGKPIKVDINDDYSDCDVVISFGNTERRLLPHQTWLHVDGAYFGRPDYVRITKNAYQPSDILKHCSFPSDRWDKFNINVKPWNPNNNGDILICKVSERNATFNNINQNDIIDEITPIIKKQTDRNIIVREKDEKFHTPLVKIIDSAWRVITWTSISGLDAIISGIPVCALTPSVCTPLSTQLSDINNPNVGDRTQLLNNIAYFQWTRDEICSGRVWKHYMQNGYKETN